MCRPILPAPKSRFSIKTLLLILAAIGCFSTNVFAEQDSVSLDSLTVKFYAQTHKPLYWFSTNETWFLSIKNWFSSAKGLKGAEQWLTAIESADNLGIPVNREQINQARAVVFSKTTVDTNVKAKTDTLITDLVLHFIKNLHQGTSRFDYDGISINRDSLYISQLLKPRYFQSMPKFIATLDCKDHDYRVYKMFLKDSLSPADSLKRKIIVRAMNYRRFISANSQSEFMVVNSAQTEAEYFKGGKLAIKMRVVVGKKTKQTPTIASYITSITTFPNWNVPHQIAVDEILPKVQKNDNYLEQNNYEVVNEKGVIIDDSELNWNDFTASNFRYFFRQSSGSENALGVVKFNLQDPFSIFLHGTSNQQNFSKDYRFLSHGCVRLEKPFDLADSLLRGKIDIKELEKGVTDKEPKFTPLQNELPTFIIYMPVIIDNGKVTFLKDEYGLMK